MTDFEKLYNFQNLYQAHTKARLGKRNKAEIIDFEMHLSENLAKLSQAISNKTYQISGYYHFMVYDPKEREIQALHYADRVVQHCLCDEIIEPVMERQLIYDNAACRKGKGTTFAMKRLSGFMNEYYRRYGAEGYVLKCDIRKYFNHINHKILSAKLDHLFSDTDIQWMLHLILDSYEYGQGTGLPMGNQTSQWFALYYMDGLDRLVKEKLGIRWYSRYMDDCVLIHQDKEYLKDCLRQMTTYIHEELGLEFNEKTQIFPLKNGVDYLGFHFYLTENGKIVKKVRRRTKQKYKKKLKYYQEAYRQDQCTMQQVSQTISSYNAYMARGNTWYLRKKILSDFVLSKN